MVDKGSDEALVFLDLAYQIIRRKTTEDIVELSLTKGNIGKGIVKSIKREFSSNEYELTLGPTSLSLKAVFQDEYLYLKRDGLIDESASLRLCATEPLTLKKFLHPGSVLVFGDKNEEYSRLKWKINRD